MQPVCLLYQCYFYSLCIGVCGHTYTTYLYMWVKMVPVLHTATQVTGQDRMWEILTVITPHHPPQASGCEKLQDPAPEVGRCSLRFLQNSQSQAHGSQGCMEAEEDRFLGSRTPQTPQTPLDASKEPRTEWGPSELALAWGRREKRG